MEKKIQGHDLERVRKMLRVEEVPDEFRDVYLRVQQAYHQVSSGPMSADTLAVLCEISGCFRPPATSAVEPDAAAERQLALADDEGGNDSTAGLLPAETDSESSPHSEGKPKPPKGKPNPSKRPPGK